MSPRSDTRRTPADHQGRLRALVAHSNDAGLVLGRDLAVELASPATERVLGSAPEVVESLPSVESLIAEDDRLRVRAALDHVLERPGARITTTFRTVGSRRTHRDVEATVANLLDDPDVAGLVMNVHDITDRRNFERALTRQALHDPLTGLPGRTLVLDGLRGTLTDGRDPRRSVAVLLVDLDRFRVVNDSLGHQEGDRLLAEVARRLVRIVRAGDAVARVGGDEFVVMCRDVDAHGLDELLPRILREIERPVDLVGGSVTLTASIGVVVARAGEHTADAALRDADAAMHVAKERGRNRFALFDASVRESAVGRLASEKALRRAIEQDELTLHYQPIVDLSSGTIIGVEGLLRWEHPERGLIEAAALVPTAEDAGLIGTVGTRALEQACAAAARWPQTHRCGAPRVWVNLAAQQLTDPGLLGTVRRVVQDSGLDPRHLGLEITETGIIGDPEAARAALTSLRELGIAFALDDFGTGYSSLAHLRSFPVDVVKIDQSFVSDLRLAERAPAIVGAIVTMSHALGLTVVAEGIEHREQLELLTSLGCDAAQGHLLGRPVPERELGAVFAG